MTLSGREARGQYEFAEAEAKARRELGRRLTGFDFAVFLLTGLFG
jgi:hypothetical protein